MDGSMNGMCSDGCCHMDLLHECEHTKDAMLLCSSDNTFIPIHKVVAAHGSPYLRRQFYEFGPNVVNGSREVYSGVNMVSVKGGFEAGKLVVAVMYNGLNAMPLEWFKHYMTESKEVERAKKIRSWVRYICDVVVIARELEMYQLAQAVALIANYNVMMHDKENSAMLIHELVLSKCTKTIDVDELCSLAKHTCWFLKASSEKDTILVCGTGVASAIQ